MKRILPFLLVLAVLFAGCALFHAPPDRVALNSLNTLDVAADGAYRGWVQDWAVRKVAADRATNTVEKAALEEELDHADKVLKAYQAGHRKATALAKLAVQTGAITNLPVILEGAKANLTNLLNQFQISSQSQAHEH